MNWENRPIINQYVVSCSPTCTHVDGWSYTGCVCKAKNDRREARRRQETEYLKVCRQNKTPTQVVKKHTHTHTQELSVLWTAAVSLDKRKLHTHRHTELCKAMLTFHWFTADLCLVLGMFQRCCWWCQEQLPVSVGKTFTLDCSPLGVKATHSNCGSDHRLQQILPH